MTMKLQINAHLSMFFSTNWTEIGLQPQEIKQSVKNQLSNRKVFRGALFVEGLLQKLLQLSHRKDCGFVIRTIRKKRYPNKSLETKIDL